MSRTRASLVFVGVMLLAIGACSDDAAKNNDSPRPDGGAGSGGSGGEAASGGTAGTGGSGGTSGSSSDAAIDAPVGTPRPFLPDDRAPEFTLLKYLEKAGPVTAPVADGWDPT